MTRPDPKYRKTEKRLAKEGLRSTRPIQPVLEPAQGRTTPTEALGRAKTRTRTAYGVAALSVALTFLAILAAFAVRYDLAKTDERLLAVEDDLAEVAATAEVYEYANEGLKSTVASLTSQVDTLTIELDRASALSDTKDAEIEELQTEVDELTNDLAAEKRKNDQPTAIPQSSREKPETSSQSVTAVSSGYPSGDRWSRSEVASVLKGSAISQGLTGSDVTFVVDKGVHIVFDGGSGSGESGGNTKAKNGQYLGLFQMGSDWGSASDRFNGAWACRRFVKTYVEGGTSALVRHWKATYY